MGYTLNAFLGKEKDLNKINSEYKNSKLIQLHNDLYIIPITEDLFDEMNKFRTNNEIEKFKLLTTDIEKDVLNIIGPKEIAYVEADYFGGKGSQGGIIWKNKTRYFIELNSEGAINEILKRLGVRKKLFKDRFDTVGLGKFRNTSEWK